MAARSSKPQWRAFLRDLIRQSNPGRDCKLTQRQAFAKLSEKFGADVSASDRQWVKDAVYDIQQGMYDGKIAAQKVLSKNKRQVLLSWVTAGPAVQTAERTSTEWIFRKVRTPFLSHHS